jgi:iron complex transport system ATP-binding protein
MPLSQPVPAGYVAPVRTPAFDLDAVSLWRWDARAARRRPIIDNLTWRARAGERWALLGPNGAGKTTLLTLVAAVEFPSSGAVEVLGERLGRTDVFRLREQIGFVDARLGRRFAPALTIEQVVRTGATGTVGLFEERLTEADRARAAALVATFGVTAISAQRFADCSHGERTRTLIARALVSRPRLLLLDEPGAGLDLAGRETLLAALSRLAVEEPDLATVVTTHHLEELPAETTHALLLADGQVVATGPVEETLTSDALSACFGVPVDVARSNGRWRAIAAA